jgi:hypothetical protein
LFFEKYLPNNVYVNISTLDFSFLGYLVKTKNKQLFVRDTIAFNKDVTLMLDCIFYKYDVVSIVKDKSILKMYQENLSSEDKSDGKEDSYIYKKGDYLVIVVDDSFYFGQIIYNDSTSIYMKDVLEYRFEEGYLRFWLFKGHLANVLFNKKFITLTSKESPTSQFTNQYKEALSKLKNIDEPSDDSCISKNDTVIVCTDSLDIIANVIDKHNYEGIYSHTIVDSKIQLWPFHDKIYIPEYKYLIAVTGNKELENFINNYHEPKDNILPFRRPGVNNDNLSL